MSRTGEFPLFIYLPFPFSLLFSFLGRRGVPVSNRRSGAFLPKSRANIKSLVGIASVCAREAAAYT